MSNIFRATRRLLSDPPSPILKGSHIKIPPDRLTQIAHDFGEDFGLLTVTVPAIDELIDTGSWVALGIVAPDDSEDDVWLAFGTTRHPARGYLN